MLPAFCKLAVCPHCRGKNEIFQLISGNTCDAMLWSDMRQLAPMLPRVSPIQKCSFCGHYFYLREAKFENGNTYSSELGWLTFEEAVEAYSELYDTEISKLELLTKIVVWAFNDNIRHSEIEAEPEHLDLLRKIIVKSLGQPIFIGNPLFRSEMYREIGEFDKCLAILNDYTPEDDFQAKIKEMMIAKAHNKESRVFLVE